MQRRQFKLQGKECVSAGIVFWRYSRDGSDVELLLQRKCDRHSWYEDLGGKSSPEDLSIQHVAAREASEEANGAFVGRFKYNVDGLLPRSVQTEYANHIEKCTQYILDLLVHSIYIVNKRTKYAMWYVHLPQHMFKKGELYFDDREYNNNYYYYRDMEWISYKKVLSLHPDMVHPRIRHFHRMLPKFGRARKDNNTPLWCHQPQCPAGRGFRDDQPLQETA